MNLALASLHPQPTRAMRMLDGRAMGVALATLTCGRETSVIVPPSLLDAFAIARADLETRPPGALALTLSHRADGHLQIHSVDTTAVWLRDGASGLAATPEVDTAEADRAIAATRLAA